MKLGNVNMGCVYRDHYANHGFQPDVYVFPMHSLRSSSVSAMKISNASKFYVTIGRFWPFVHVLC